MHIKAPAANALNFGKLARQGIVLTREEMTAALVRMVGQVIAVIIFNAALAEKLDTVIITRNLADLPSVRKVIDWWQVIIMPGLL